MRYITQNYIEIKPIECAGCDYYQIGLNVQKRRQDVNINSM